MEQERLLLAQHGDRDAIHDLVTTYQQPVFSLCYRMLGERQEAEDAAQETLIKAVTKLHTYDAARPFKPWILRTASNECIDRLRRRKPEVSLDGLGDDGAWEWQAGNSPNPEAVLLESEHKARVRALLETLSPLDRAMIVMFYWEGLSYQEIAEATEQTVSAIKSRLFRARRSMAVEFMEKV